MYTVKFSINKKNQRIPLLDKQGKEVALIIEAATRKAAIYSTEVEKFCTEQGNDCRVRSVI